MSNDVYFKASLQNTLNPEVGTFDNVENKEHHYLDTNGLTSLWSKIKFIFATKSELASKANISDLSNYYTKSEVDYLLRNTGSDKYGENIVATEAEGGDDTLGGLSFWNTLERAPGYDGTSQMNVAEDADTMENE